MAFNLHIYVTHRKYFFTNQINNQINTLIRDDNTPSIPLSFVVNLGFLSQSVKGVLKIISILEKKNCLNQAALILRKTFRTGIQKYVL